jgi:TolB protein
MSIKNRLRSIRTRLALTISIAVPATLLIMAVLSEELKPGYRQDGASELPIFNLDGSLQNPAWSPDGGQVVFTRFRGGYNNAPGDLMIFDRASDAAKALIADGHSNVSQPGSTWNARTDYIVFSSTRTDHDQIFMMRSQRPPEPPRQLTSDEQYMSYEPSISPDGQSVVFESHIVDQEGNGRIRQVAVGSLEVDDLTDEDEDCRQPNWSPAGNLIVYQKKDDGQWDLWIYDVSTKEHRKLTEGEGDKTDATFSPDGHWLVYSSDSSELRHANLFVINVRGGPATQITRADAYDGAPSWSPDGKSIVFESGTYPTAPRLRGRLTRMWRQLISLFRPQPPTRIWTIKVPEDLLQRLCLPGAPCHLAR